MSHWAKALLVALLFVVCSVSTLVSAVPSTFGLESELVRAAAMSDSDKVTYAKDSLKELNTAVQKAKGYHAAADKAGDDDGRKCVAQRLNMLLIMAQTCNYVVNRMGEITAEEDGEGVAERMGHEVRKVAVAITQGRKLLSEAERCSGAGKGTSGGGSVVVDHSLMTTEDEDLIAALFDAFDIGFDPDDTTPYL